MSSAPTDVVVDASLGLKWVLNETDTPAALLLLSEWEHAGIRRVAPSWCACETGNVLFQSVRRGELTLAEVQELLDLVLAAVTLLPEEPADTRRAMALAHQHGQRATYDAQYLALAQHLGCELWTADERFVAALGGSLPFVHALSERPSAT